MILVAPQHWWHCQCLEPLAQLLRAIGISRSGQTQKIHHHQLRDLLWPEPSVGKLRDFCISSLYGVIAELNGYSDETLQRLHMATESWFHLTGRGGYFGVHNHALHAWSGVYCVRHEGDDPNSLSGRLTFVHPNAHAAMYIDKSTSQMRAPYGFGPVSLRLTAGDLVIFPSWLLHHVQPYEGEGHRITVAFNCSFKAGR